MGVRLSPDDALQVVRGYFRDYGTVVGGHIAGKTMAFLADPQDIELILSSPVHIDKSLEYR